MGLHLSDQSEHIAIGAPFPGEVDGNIARTVASDTYTPPNGSTAGGTSQSLTALNVTDFEVVDMGNPVTWNGSCVRNPGARRSGTALQTWTL